ncbi:TPA: MFS transporter, partial [Citrobacter freundii]|nr:MFS transporter [Citrobacter freundii]
MLSPQPNRWVMLLVVMLAFLPIVLDLTILHVAIPSLTLALEATGTEVLWIIDIYPLLMASLLIPMGTLADRIGHRRLLFIGLSVFGVGSALAAMSPTAQALIGARALMAVGAAMVMPCTLAIIRQTFKDDTERATALGIWAAVASAGEALGPLAGGALLEHFWWGSVFLVNVPVLALAIPLVFFLAPRHAVLAEGAWKPAQALLLMAGLMATVYAIKTGLKSDGAWWLNLVIGCIGTAMLAWFVRIQLRSTHAMLDMSLFSKPAIRMGVVMALVVMGSLAGVELLLAQELQFVTGRSPLEAGLFMLPLMMASAVGGPLAG